MLDYLWLDYRPQQKSTVNNRLPKLSLFGIFFVQMYWIVITRQFGKTVHIGLSKTPSDVNSMPHAHATHGSCGRRQGSRRTNLHRVC